MDKAIDDSPAVGPLMVSAANPRYFTTASGEKAVYLTGSHIWNNLQGRDGSRYGLRRDP